MKYRQYAKIPPNRRIHLPVCLCAFCWIHPNILWQHSMIVLLSYPYMMQLSLFIKFIYNKGTTKLAFHSNETSEDKLSIIYNWPSIIVIHVHAKLHKNLFISTCSLHWNIKSSWEVCEKPVLWWKTLMYWIDICCMCTLELPLWGNSNVYQQHMLLKLRKPFLK